MKLVGLMSVRNEQHILGYSLRAALKWCDEVIVHLHSCDDRSEEIAMGVRLESNGRVIIRETDQEMWDEMPMRQSMLDRARGDGATHIAIIDADEVLTANLVPTISQWIEAVPEGRILQLPGYNSRHGINQFHANGIWGNRWFSLAFKDSPDLCWSGDRFHHREPLSSIRTPGAIRSIEHGLGGILHFWGANEARLIAKHRLYRVVERIRFPNKPIYEIERMYGWATKGRPEAKDTPASWTFAPVPQGWHHEELLQYLNVDAPNWQDAEADRLIEKHGRDYFAGLDV